MPRNSLLNGKAAPDTGGLQLDEVAYPILMAVQAGLGGDAALWADHIRPAADFLVAHGPSDGIERWEEQTGYSPSTIAAEIAGLTAASAIAAQQHDPGPGPAVPGRRPTTSSAASSPGTVTTTGPDAAALLHPAVQDRGPERGDHLQPRQRRPDRGPAQRHRRRLPGAGPARASCPSPTPTCRPHWACWTSRSRSARPAEPATTGTAPRPPTAARTATATATSRARPRARPPGAPWPPTDTGTGHLWPVLSGERAESDIAAGQSAGAAGLLNAMINFSSGVGLVPEQAWEDPDLPRVAVRQRPGDRVHRVHRRQGRGLGLAADLGAGPGAPADRRARRLAAPSRRQRSPRRATSPTGRRVR